MFVLLHFVVGLIVLHAAWLVFYLVGTLVWAPIFTAPQSAKSRGDAAALLELVLATAAGMAIVAFATFGLGMLRLLYPLCGIAAIGALFATFVLLGESPFTRSFWSVRFSLVRRSITPWSAGLYAACLALALPAILPPTAFDPLFYHFTYALEWSQAHRITVDPWLRFPYYANNWLLLESWMFTFGRGANIQFLGWFAGMLALLGVYGFVCALDESHAAPIQVRLAALFAGASILFAPVFLRWIDVGMNDAPIGFCYFASIAAVTAAISKRERRYAYYALLCFPFFIGMKSVFLAMLPVAAVGVWAALRATGASMRMALAAVGIAVALSLPWYVKNLIGIGDPVPPLLSVLLHRPDPNWSAADIAGVASDLRGNQSPLFLLGLPLGVVLHPDSLDYREPGVSLIMLLTFVPGIALAYGVLRRRNGALLTPGLIFNAYLCYAILFWLVTSHLARYALLFYPSLAAFAALGALRWAKTSRLRMTAALATLGILALPAPAGASFLAFLWQVDYLHLADVYTSTDSYLMTNLAGYAEEEYVSRLLVRAGIAEPRVYIFGDDTLDYYFKRHGVSKIGDWFNRGRYGDFVAAIDRGDGAGFLHALGADAFVMSTHPLLTPARTMRLTRELLRAGYREMIVTNSANAVFLNSAIAW